MIILIEIPAVYETSTVDDVVRSRIDINTCLELHEQVILIRGSPLKGDSYYSRKCLPQTLQTLNNFRSSLPGQVRGNILAFKHMSKIHIVDNLRTGESKGAVHYIRGLQTRESDLYNGAAGAKSHKTSG